MTRPYAGATIVVASRHGKAAVVRPAFASVIGARVVADRGIDTDRFGTFTGDVPRPGTAEEIVLAKALLGIARTGIPRALASEATYRGGVAGVGDHRELLVFRDEERALTVLESMRTPVGIAGVEVATAEEAVEAARRQGAPGTGVVLLAGARPVAKGLRDEERVRAAAHAALATEPHLIVHPDLRAHHNPARRAIIRSLAERLARRLDTPCPACAAPGWGRVDRIAGLPCAACGTPTDGTIAVVDGCAACPHRELRPEGPHRVEPADCPACNP